MSRDRLVSTTITKERREELRARIADQRKVRAEGDPFFKITEWMLEEWEAAERDAAREYVPTSRAAALTGWSEQTLRRYAGMARAGEPMPEGWQGLQAVRHGKHDWTFCVSTIPVKSTAAA